MRYSAALSSQIHTDATRHLIRSDGQEDLCFGLWFPSRGETRTTAVLQTLLLPQDGERSVHGNASFAPAYFQRALAAAMTEGAGLAFMHSHPWPGWQDMSIPDVNAERNHAAATKASTALPLLGLTLGTDGAWSARFWDKISPRTYERRWCESVRVVGERFDITYNDALVPRRRRRPELTRTVSAWGPDAQARLARLTVGVIGAGSVGSIIGEAMARMGIAHVRLIDFDSVERVNLDRLLHATRRDALLNRSKVEVLARGLRRGATAKPFTVDPLERSVVEEEGFRAALDCDVLFSCVDRPWPRSVLNFIAYAHLIPVVDGGIQIQKKETGLLRHADWRAHVAAPTRRCLACLGQYEPGDVATERDGYLDDPTYITGLPRDHHLRRNENVFAFSLGAGSLEVLQLLSMVIAPLGISNPGAQLYHFVTANLDTDIRGCDSACAFPKLTARGDRSGITVTARHAIAEQARTQRQQHRSRHQR